MKKITMIVLVSVACLLLSTTFCQLITVSASRDNSEINNYVQDLGLRECIAEKLNVLVNSNLSEKQLQSIHGNLDCSNRGIKNISGIESLIGIESLNLSGNRITDVTQIEQLKQIKKIDVSNNSIYNFQFLKKIKASVKIDNQNIDIGRLERGEIVDLEGVQILGKDIKIAVNNGFLIKNTVKSNQVGKGQVIVTNNKTNILSMYYEIVEEQVPKCSSSLFGEIIQPSSIKYKDIEIEKYCTFKNNKEAAAKFNLKYKSELNKYGVNLDSILSQVDPTSAFKKFTNNLYKMRTWYKTPDVEMTVKEYYNYKNFISLETEMLTFLDIYENLIENENMDVLLAKMNESNDKANKKLDMSTQSTNKKTLFYELKSPKEFSDSTEFSESTDLEMELYLLAPNTNNRLENIVKNKNKSRLLKTNKMSLNKNKFKEAESLNFQKYGIGKFDEQKAVDYALKYAESPNPDPHFLYIPDHDCTNFVSQILYAGGKPVSGAWYFRVPGTKNPTKAWINANEFTKLHGTAYKSKDFSSIVAKAFNSDVIGFDNTKDGQWDHLGYVLGKKFWRDGTHPMLHIAQHSNNYIKWDYETGWVKVGQDGGSYVVVAK